VTKRIRVLVVDDSLFMRAAIAKTLAAGPFEVVGQARDGAEAVAQVPKLTPDVITMDFNMPGMNGAETVRTIMQQRPTPVVMFSAHTKQGARETFDALAAGAVDFVTKPAGEVSTDLTKIADELTRKLVAAASAKPRAATPPAPPSRPSGQFAVRAATNPGGAPRVCVIAVSTGGPAALSEVIPALSPDLRLAIVVVQHMPAAFTAPFAERLDAASRVKVREAQVGDRPEAGEVLIAPGNKHLEFDAKGLVTLSDGALVNGCRPAADITMQSAAKVYGRRALAVVMTGMGKDGAAGALAIKKVEGKTCAQDEKSSVIYGMPKAAVEAGAIDEVVTLAELATWLRYA
jgi:two-component system, chemotaxis family, protein-glutamate methylesterase/glutaminase